MVEQSVARRLVEQSIARRLVEQLVANVGVDGARRIIVTICREKMDPLERAALAARWAFWARPKQLPPAGEWRSWGFLTARGYGKTRTCQEYVTGEIEAGRIGSLGLCAQNEDKSEEIYIDGATGLVKGAPPWFRPRWEASAKQLVWPNGATGVIRTPHEPGNIRSGEHHLVWLSEIQSWPVATMKEAILNFQFATRAGYARTLWDATPKRAHPILTAFLARAKANPEKHHVVRGSMQENEANLGEGVVADLRADYEGTAQGREELEGEMLTESDSAIAHQLWIDRNRRPMPEAFARRGIGVDPAITSRKYSDNTGIVDAGVGFDGQGYVIGDHGGKHRVEAWGDLVVDLYVRNDCDILVAERNRGGDHIVYTIRIAAKARDLRVVVLEKNNPIPPKSAGTIFVREVHSRGEKADRARPLSSAYKHNRISHVIGADLANLELTLTTWEPTPGSDSPDDLDAENLIMTELLGLSENEIDPHAGMDGIVEFAQGLAMGTPPGTVEAVSELAELLRGGGPERI